MDAAEALAILQREHERGRALFADAAGREELERAQVAVLGRKAPFSEVQRSLGSLPEDDRRNVGRRANEVRAALQEALQARQAELEVAEEAGLLEEDRLDVSLPGRRPRAGSLHPISIAEYEAVDIFQRMGYRVVEGMEVETEWYNFDALNIPPSHPARKVTDTLYLDVPGHPELLLRTETSAVQIHTMEAQPPPVYVVAPGKVYRRDTWDPTHSPVFQQIECLAVDEGISFADLKGTVETFARAMFGADRRVRFTASFFPFVEPGAQAEVSCFLCDGVGCRTCGNGWIEILGCGMVHPNVLRNVGYDAERYTGFAFGMGIERVAMLRHGIPDIRLLYEGDVRFLQQFQRVSA